MDYKGNKMATKGYFVITDISGYTEYLTRSELEHANEILQSLFDAQIAAIRHPFVISGFRGDAIFMYVPETNFVQAQSFVEALENFYIVFEGTLQQMQYNTTCTCRACKNMGMLGLKMCIHYGEYLVQKLGDREELLGSDVIVPHRMLKNKVTEQTGIKAYAIFSQASAAALCLAELSQPLIMHSESYEHLGEVKMQVFDLASVWKNVQEQNRRVVTKEEAWVFFEGEVPYSPLLVWEYLTTPALEARILQLDYVERTDELGGRVRENAGFHCAHGDLHFYSRIIDWKPFEYYTFSQTAAIFDGAEYLQTRHLTRLEKGMHLLVTLGVPDRPTSEEQRQGAQGMVNTFGNITAVIAQDIADGKVTDKEA